jgi:hypothetical protein
MITIIKSFFIIRMNKYLLNYLIIIGLLIILFFVFNSIIWIDKKKLTNINDIIIRYLMYMNFIIIIAIIIYLLFY